MNPFELITDDEVIYQMCQSWDTPTLLNMSETHTRIYDVCYKEIQKRKKEHQDRIDELVDEIWDIEDYWIKLEKIIEGWIVEVYISRMITDEEIMEEIEEPVGLMGLSQFVPFDISSKVPWIIPDMAHNVDKRQDEIRRYGYLERTGANIDKLAENLINQGYKKMG